MNIVRPVNSMVVVGNEGPMAYCQSGAYCEVVGIGLVLLLLWHLP